MGKPKAPNGPPPHNYWSPTSSAAEPSPALFHLRRETDDDAAGSDLGVAYPLAHYPDRHRLASVTFGWVQQGDRRHHEADHYCRKCNELLELIQEEDVATIPCYKCGGRLTGWDEAAVLWD